MKYNFYFLKNATKQTNTVWLHVQKENSSRREEVSNFGLFWEDL